MKKSLLYLIMFLMVQITLGFLISIVIRVWFHDVKPDGPQAIIITTSAASILLSVLFVALKWCPVSRNYIRTRPWHTILWSAALALGMVIPLTWLEEQLPESWVTNVLNEEMALIMKSPEGYFSVCMLAPLMEEIVFRGAMIRALKNTFASMKNGEWIAISISALLFALAHLNPAQIPHAFVVGLLLGWLFVKTGSIVPGVIVHWINNSISYVFVNMFPWLPVDAKLAEYFGGNNTTVLMAVGYSLLIALPALYQLIKGFEKSEAKDQII